MISLQSIDHQVKSSSSDQVVDRVLLESVMNEEVEGLETIA